MGATWTSGPVARCRMPRRGRSKLHQRPFRPLRAGERGQASDSGHGEGQRCHLQRTSGRGHRQAPQQHPLVLLRRYTVPQSPWTAQNERKVRECLRHRRARLARSRLGAAFRPSSSTRDSRNAYFRRRRHTRESSLRIRALVVSARANVSTARPPSDADAHSRTFDQPRRSSSAASARLISTAATASTLSARLPPSAPARAPVDELSRRIAAHSNALGCPRSHGGSGDGHPARHTSGDEAAGACAGLKRAPFAIRPSADPDTPP